MLRPSLAPPVNVGDVLASKYRVEGVLGNGGMGVVVAATHLDLEQKVALKFLLPSTAADPVIVERFLREARASVRLKSPHVAKTLDTGRLENGCPFIVMELLEGRDLDAEVGARGGSLPVEEAASYVLQACDALAEAHAVGIVHRDLKPANLFLARGHDGHYQVKVLDFGISKVLQSAGSQPVSMTATDSVFGSPAYMSPEQMRSSKDVDARTDIWSVGVVLYELVTGRLPFEGPTALEIGLKASQEQPARPTALRPDLPERFERIILRCLEKDPNRRFASVADLALALAPFAQLRDRSIAERVCDVARAGASRMSGAPSSHADRRMPDAPVDRISGALDDTQVARDETKLATAKTQIAHDRTEPAVTKEARTETRTVGRPLAAAALVAIAVGVGAIVIVQRLARTPEPATAEATASSPSAAESSMAGRPELASSALQVASAPISNGPGTEIDSRAADASAAAVAQAVFESPAGGARAATQPAPTTRSNRPVSKPSASTTASSAVATPDAGRFFRVRE